MRATRGLAVLVGGCALVLWVCGCEGGAFGGEPTKLIPQEQLGNSEVPVPTDFEMDETDSHDKSTGGWRYIRHTYVGKAEPQLVRAFYREQLPLVNWKLTKDEMRQGQYMMHFESDVETCEITISRIKERWSTKTKLQIEVSPRDRGKAIELAPTKK